MHALLLLGAFYALVHYQFQWITLREKISVVAVATYSRTGKTERAYAAEM